MSPAEVLRTRADIVLRRVPVVRALPERALYCAYRTKDLHLGGFSDKASAAR